MVFLKMSFLFLFMANFCFAQEPKFIIRWSVAHDPSNQRVLESVEQFGRQLSAASKGEIKVVLDHFHTEQNLHFLAAGKVFRGELEMSQVATAAVASYSPAHNVLDLPFLFRSHEHAAKNLDGELGKRLLKDLLKNSNERVRGLAFTYSGGYRQIYGSREISKIEDFEGLKMFEPTYRMGTELFDLFKVRYVGAPGQPKQSVLDSLKKGIIDVEDGEYNRLGTLYKMASPNESKLTVVSETNHSLFLTTIIINEAFFQKLPPKYQDLISTAAQEMAIAERQISIQQEAGNKEVLKNAGFKIVVFPETEKAKLQQKAKAIYQKYAGSLGELVSLIEKTK